MNSKNSLRMYWASTILFAAFMLLSGVMSLIPSPEGAKALTDLGYPVYLNTILGVAKILGAVAILQPKYKTIKEWAYAGFTIDLVGASASFILSSNGLSSLVLMIPFFVVLFTSYYFWKKTN